MFCLQLHSTTVKMNATYDCLFAGKEYEVCWISSGLCSLGYDAFLSFLHPFLFHFFAHTVVSYFLSQFPFLRQLCLVSLCLHLLTNFAHIIVTVLFIMSIITSYV